MSNKNILKILILCTVFAFSIGIASAAPPNLPMGLYGNVNIGASPAPVDTRIDGKVGTQVVASTKVVNAGKYGDNNNYLGISAATEGKNVDIYVNDVKVATLAYTPGKSTQVNLNAPGTSSSGSPSGSSSGPSGGPSGGSSNSVGGGGVSGAGGTPIVTSIQQPVSSKGTMPGTPEKGTPVTTPGVPLEFKFSSILAVFGLLVGAIIIFALKKTGKI